MTNSEALDASLMARAVALAERGRATTPPNPMVGCVLTNRGEIVGEGWHERAGAAHAEVRALEAAGSAARGATAHVSLEPCDHQGRTPPCSSALIAAGISRLVFGLADPNPTASGGAARLARSGVDVSGGLLAPVVAAQNRRFLVNVTRRRSLVTLKLAQTASGGLTPAEGRWVTGATARTRVHRLRASHDAVLVGVGTVLADDPRLDVRHVLPHRGQPRPIVVDSRGRTPPTAQVVRPGAMILTTAAAPEGWRSQLSGRGVDVIVGRADASDRVDLVVAAGALLERGVYSVLAEPGPTLASALVQAGLVDRLVLHVAGGEGPVDPAPCREPPTGTHWRAALLRRLGGDRERIYVLEEST